MAYYIITVGIKTEYIGKAAERLRRKTKGPVKWQPAAFLRVYAGELYSFLFAR